MRRTTVMLPDDLHRRATLRAAEGGISMGEYVRQALRERLDRDSGWKFRAPLLDDDAVYRGDAPANLAARHDLHLHGDPE